MEWLSLYLLVSVVVAIVANRADVPVVLCELNAAAEALDRLHRPVIGETGEVLGCLSVF
jgi:hypothetical protein